MAGGTGLLIPEGGIEALRGDQNTAQSLKGRQALAIEVSLKRYPDTNPASPEVRAHTLLNRIRILLHL